MDQDKWLGGQDKVPWGHDKNKSLLSRPKNGCREAPLACLGLRTSDLPPMKNDIRPFES
jgi:hypothetical protein